MRLFNTLTKSVDEFHPIESGKAKVYSCGPTVYDVAHIGNMRAFIVADLVQRALRVVGGYDVNWVMNITDIDDKTIRDSAASSKKWNDGMGEQTSDVKANLGAYTKFFEERFIEDIVAVGIDRTHFAHMPRATDFIKSMQDLTKQIVDKGLAYISDGSVYFNVEEYRKSHEYGRLFHIDVENFRQGVRIDADEYDRESVSDFVLWKGRKDGEPYWDFELNGEQLPGRPGWHIECSAMSSDLLGLPIDVHTGGVDLRFPHHEDELAQCCAGYGIKEQSTFWVHNEHLDVDGKKMSKSLGNFYTLRDLINKGIDPLDFRYAILAAHYRTKMNFTIDGLKSAGVARRRIQEFIWDLLERSDATPVAANSSDLQNGMLNKVFEALADDLHTPRAFAELNTFLNNTNVDSITTHQAAALLGELIAFNNVIAVWSFNARPEILIPEDVKAIANERWTARTSKNWSESDRLRQVLEEKGWSVKDGKDSYELFPMENGKWKMENGKRITVN